MARISASVFIILIYLWKTNALCETCSSTNHYRCTKNNQYQFCDHSNNPVGSTYTCPVNTYCSGGTTICGETPDCLCGICATVPAPGFPTIACVTDTQFARCTSFGDIVPDTVPTNCPAGTRCSTFSFETIPCVPNSSPETNDCPAGSGPSGGDCPSVGRYPVDNTSCKNYRLCTTLANGTLTYYVYTCPGTSAFNPVSQTCSSTYLCPL